MLVVVGTGIQLGGHLTLASQGWIQQADKVLFAVADPLTAEWLRTLNVTAEPLPYATHPRRRDTYRAMAARILDEVQSEQVVCAIFYGHPGVFAEPAHEALRMVQAAGFPAQMLPGISAEDCLFADLGVDPARHGCQSFEATDFLIRRRRWDPSSALVLWQVGMIGNPGFDFTAPPTRGLALLREVLVSAYTESHEGVIYEAAPYPTFAPTIHRFPLGSLPNVPVRPISTLYIPPHHEAPVDEGMLARLGLSL